MSKIIGVDPAVANIGIVVMDAKGNVEYAQTLKTGPHGKSRPKFFSRLSDLGNQYYKAEDNELFSLNVIRAVIYAPHYQHGESANNYYIPISNGMAYMMCRRLTDDIIWRDDKPTRSALAQLGYGNITPKLKGGKLTKAVKHYWPECKNEHLACAWIAAEYGRRTL